MKSIRRRFLLLFIGLSIVPTLLVGVVLTLQSYSIQRQRALDLQQQTALYIAAQVAGYIHNLESQLIHTVQVGDFSASDLATRTSILSQLLSFQSGFDQLTLLDRAGREQIRLNRIRLVSAAELSDRSDSNEFQQPVATKRTYFGPLAFNAMTGEPLIPIAVPLVEIRSGSVEAVLVGDARIRLIWDLLRAFEVSGGGQVYLVDENGQVVAHRIPAVVLRGTHFDLPDEDGITPGLHGSRVVLSRTPVILGDYTYYAVAEQEATTALALTVSTVLVTLLVTTIALLVAAAAGFLMAHGIVLPIENLSRAAKAVESGDRSVRIESYTQDEIGLLARAFNNMAARLDQTLEGLEQQVFALRIAEQHVQRLNADLERRVEERTSELQVANERLTELDRLKSKFVADLSHELRTPIAILNTRVYLLERRPEKFAEYVSGLKEQIELLTRFVNSVFDLSRLDLGGERLKFKSVDLDAILRQVISVLAPRAEVAGLALVYDDTSSGMIVRGEPNLLSQMITNLITNAIQYTPSGRVEVLADVVEDGRSAQLEVRDTGIGISEPDLPHVFQRFFRGSNVGQSTLHGIGLGLSVVHQIVVLHEGDIRVSSELGSGSAFIVRLPIDPASRSSSGSHISLPDPREAQRPD